MGGRLVGLHGRHRAECGMEIQRASRREECSIGEDCGDQGKELTVSQPTADQQNAKAENNNYAWLGNRLVGKLDGVERENGRVRIVVRESREFEFRNRAGKSGNISTVQRKVREYPESRN